MVTWRACRCNTQLRLDRSPPVTIHFTPLPTHLLRHLLCMISSAITNRIRAHSSHRGREVVAALVALPRVDPVLVHHLHLPDFLVLIAASLLPEMIFCDDIWHARQELLLSPLSTDRRVATNVQGQRLDAISKFPLAVGVEHEVNSAPTLLDPVIPTFAKQEMPVSCLEWINRCST